MNKQNDHKQADHRSSNTKSIDHEVVEAPRTAPATVPSDKSAGQDPSKFDPNRKIAGQKDVFGGDLQNPLPPHPTVLPQDRDPMTGKEPKDPTATH